MRRACSSSNLGQGTGNASARLHATIAVGATGNQVAMSAEYPLMTQSGHLVPLNAPRLKRRHERFSHRVCRRNYESGRSTGGRRFAAGIGKDHGFSLVVGINFTDGKGNSITIAPGNEQCMS